MSFDQVLINVNDRVKHYFRKADWFILISMGKKQRHHTVQNAYLQQWADGDGQLNVYSFEIGKVDRKGPGWRKFYKENYNVLDKESGDIFFPEAITSEIDTKAIAIIRSLKEKKYSLNGEERSIIAYYCVLQYLRTPRMREQQNKIIDSFFKEVHKSDFLSHIEKVDPLKVKYDDDAIKNEAFLDQIRDKSTEYKNAAIEAVKENKFTLSLNNVGQSKLMLKGINSDIVKDFFSCRWEFWLTTKDTSFITSDNPCFTISNNKFGNGIGSSTAKTYFPLSPDVCLVVDGGRRESRKEFIYKISKICTREVNKLVMDNCLDVLVARDKKQLMHLLKRYDTKNHRSNKSVAVYKNGDYIVLNME